MPNPVEIHHLEERWRTLSAQETTQANALLGDAWWMLVARRPNLPDDVAGSEMLRRNVIRVVSAMCIRVMRNPEGWESETTGPFGGRRADWMASGRLYVDDEEIASLSSGRGGAFTITPKDRETSDDILQRVALVQDSWGNRL